MTSGTFGRTGTGSSSTTVLTSLLGSKLQAETASGGSILYRTIWQELTTPAGRSLSALRASAWTGGAAPNRSGWNGPYAFVPIPWLDGIWLPLPIGLINLLASAGSISGNDFTLSGYPTPRTGTGGPESAARKKELGRMDSGGSDLQAVALMAGWPTADASKFGENLENEMARRARLKEKHGNGNGAGMTLALSAQLTGWSTASARDWKDSEGMATERPDGSRSRLDQLPRQAMLAGWSTSRAEDAESSGMRWSRGKADTLTAQATHLAGWPTAMAGTPAQNGNSVAGNNDQTRNTMSLMGVEVAGATVKAIEDWGPARINTDGAILIGSFAGMEAGGQLDPEHSRWLMRIPAAWGRYAPTETPSTLKRRRLSRESSFKSSESAIADDRGSVA